MVCSGGAETLMCSAAGHQARTAHDGQDAEDGTDAHVYLAKCSLKSRGMRAIEYSVQATPSTAASWVTAIA